MNYIEFVKECFKYQLIGFVVELLYDEAKINYKEFIKPTS